MSIKFRRKRTSPFTEGKSPEVWDLERTTCHGFEEFKSGESMAQYFHKDPNGNIDSEFEPPIYQHISARDLKISRGL